MYLNNHNNLYIAKQNWWGLWYCCWKFWLKLKKLYYKDLCYPNISLSSCVLCSVTAYGQALFDSCIYIGVVSLCSVRAQLHSKFNSCSIIHNIGTWLLYYQLTYIHRYVLITAAMMKVECKQKYNRYHVVLFMSLERAVRYA